MEPSCCVFIIGDPLAFVATTVIHPYRTEVGAPGKGLLLWFVVDDFDESWERAQALGAPIEEPPNTDNGTFMRAFVIREPDGYNVAVNETGLGLG
jgi:hypothetical protein